MGWKIVTETEPLVTEQVVLVIYGQPGIGKTTLAQTASRPLLLDFDGGAQRAGIRRAIIPVTSWSDVSPVDADALRDFDTVIVDTAGRMLDVITASMIRRDAKMGRGDGTPSLQGWGRLRTMFRAWLTEVREAGKDVVIIAHSEESQRGEETVERLDIAGGSKKIVYQEATAMAAIGTTNRRRQLRFSPTDTSYGKDPAGLGNIWVPEIGDGSSDNDFLERTIALVKRRMNERHSGTQPTPQPAVVATPEPEPTPEPPKQAEGDAVFEEPEATTEAAAPVTGLTQEVLDSLTLSVTGMIERNAPREEREELAADLKALGARWDKGLKRVVAVEGEGVAS